MTLPFAHQTKHELILARFSSVSNQTNTSWLPRNRLVMSRLKFRTRLQWTNKPNDRAAAWSCSTRHHRVPLLLSHASPVVTHTQHKCRVLTAHAQPHRHSGAAARAQVVRSGGRYHRQPAALGKQRIPANSLEATLTDSTYCMHRSKRIAWPSSPHCHHNVVLSVCGCGRNRRFIMKSRPCLVCKKIYF